jgi:hypothetical protein
VVAITGLVAYVVAYAFSFGPITWLFLSEAFPDPVRGRAAAVASGLNWATNIAVSLSFLTLMGNGCVPVAHPTDAITVGGALLLYGCVCIAAAAAIFGGSQCRGLCVV